MSKYTCCPGGGGVPGVVGGVPGVVGGSSGTNLIVNSNLSQYNSALSTNNKSCAGYVSNGMNS